MRQLVLQKSYLQFRIEVPQIAVICPADAHVTHRINIPQGKHITVDNGFFNKEDP